MTCDITSPTFFQGVSDEEQQGVAAVEGVGAVHCSPGQTTTTGTTPAVSVGVSIGILSIVVIGMLIVSVIVMMIVIISVVAVLLLQLVHTQGGGGEQRHPRVQVGQTRVQLLESLA